MAVYRVPFRVSFRGLFIILTILVMMFGKGSANALQGLVSIYLYFETECQTHIYNVSPTVSYFYFLPRENILTPSIATNAKTAK